MTAFVPPRTLSKFMKSDAFVRAVVGPLGSGKSSACVREIPRRAGRQRPGPDGVRRTRFAVIRNTRPQLQDTTRKTFEQWIPHGQWNEQEFTCTLRGPVVGPDGKTPDGTEVECEVLFRALDRPQDVKKVLSLELTGAYINEAREIPKEVVDGLQGRVGRYPPKKDGGATWFGVFMDSNPWHTAHWGYELFSRQKPQGFELFEQPGGRADNAENLENLPDGYYQRLLHGKDAEWVAEYVDGQYPSADRGSVYGHLVANLEARGGVSAFAHPSDGVFAVFDLGVSDSTAIWWFRIGANGLPDVIDWYEASGEGMSHYFDVLDGKTPPGCDRARPYALRKIWLPHDARQRTFQTGVSTLDQFLAKYPSRVAIVPELDIESGIAAGRWLLEQDIRVHSRCDEGVRRLKAYRYEWDEDNKCFRKKPLHDWTSHTADDWRYLAAVSKATALAMRPAEKPKPVVVKPEPLNLQAILDKHVRNSRRGRRI